MKLSINNGAMHQFSLLAHTVPVSIELDREEVVMKVRVGDLWQVGWGKVCPHTLKETRTMTHLWQATLLLLRSTLCELTC